MIFDSTHIFHLLFLVVSSAMVFRLVIKKRLTEKYALFLLAVLSIFFLNVLFFHRFFFLQDTLINVVTSAIFVVGVLSAVIGLVMLTQYSKERRQSIQELALLRHDFDELRVKESVDQDQEKKSLSNPHAGVGIGKKAIHSRAGTAQT